MSETGLKSASQQAMQSYTNQPPPRVEIPQPGQDSLGQGVHVSHRRGKDAWITVTNQADLSGTCRGCEDMVCGT